MLIEKLFRYMVIGIQLILVAIFILFEEVIWEGIAWPIYRYMHQLQILQKIETYIIQTNKYLILIVFVILLAGVELAGVTAGVMLVKGMVWSAVLLYALKIPIAAFVFWLFRVTEAQLMSFGWFRWVYLQITGAFGWIKSRKIYQETIAMLHTAQDKLRHLKATYLSDNNTISKRFRRLYRTLKKHYNQHP